MVLNIKRNVYAIFMLKYSYYICQEKYLIQKNQIFIRLTCFILKIKTNNQYKYFFMFYLFRVNINKVKYYTIRINTILKISKSQACAIK